jgi:hypothetical protein
MTHLITRLRDWSHARHAAPASDLMDEAADEIERLNKLREEDGVAMGALIAGYQRLQAACIDGLQLQG